ncbi:hypothetical protein Val02_78240 [Virgisporangium aliadipatigenens]|uniref:Uncharacterized protein n=1 Tax=Virgisporangium aliadipatigenens TaxID=741659 RepID=A0A8J4DV97_9ACTN|nr:hypothetical protein [Virgisporangium aliadipatigenens]GIJ50938.1 hypothetical protein Val02_78240 [Virgisporangium aliadipatigenens]
MDLFPISDGMRSVPAAPGARRYDVSLDGLHERLRSVLGGLSVELQAGLFVPLPAGADDDPDLAPALAVCGPRLLPLQDLAILPPELRFNSTRLGGNHRIFAARRWINGVNGYAIAPSEFRPAMSVWSHSEGGLFSNGEYGPLAEWLAEQIEPLEDLLAGMAADDDEFEPDEIAKLTDQAAVLWERLREDLPPAQPRPAWAHPGADWTGTSVAGVPTGRWTMTRDGVVVREEHYRNGLRHGPVTRWHPAERIKKEFASLSREQLMAIDEDWLESVQGAVERVGTFVDGAAHGEFRFFDNKGRPLQEGRYEHGWPEGRWTVHPEAAVGLADTASVEYSAGIPVSWTIPPLAFDSVPVNRVDAPVTTLAALSRDANGFIVVNCTQTSEHDLAEEDARELAGLPGILVVGVHPAVPGRGSFGGRPIDIVADPAAGLTRAYGAQHERLSLLTYLDKHGRLLGGSERLTRLRPAKWFDLDSER